MSGDSEIEKLSQLIEDKRKAVEWWKEEVERYTERIENNTGSELLHGGVGEPVGVEETVGVEGEG